MIYLEENNTNMFLLDHNKVNILSKNIRKEYVVTLCCYLCDQVIVLYYNVAIIINIILYHIHGILI